MHLGRPPARLGQKLPPPCALSSTA